MQRRAVWLIAMLILGSLASAQQQSTILYGTVTDRDSKETLIGVNLSLEDHTGTSSDENGQYRLEIPPDRQKLTISFIGYETQNRVVTLTPGEERLLDIELIEQSQQLDIVVVSASQYEKRLEETTVSIDVLPSRLLANTN